MIQWHLKHGKQGKLYAETESAIIAIQDRIVTTNNYKEYIMKENVQEICRICSKSQEAIEHIISGCSSIAHIEYTHRYDNLDKLIHQTLANKYKLTDDITPYYKYHFKGVVDNTTHKLLEQKNLHRQNNNQQQTRHSFNTKIRKK